MTNLEKIAARSLPALTAQRISADGPGTIVRDIETLIDFIGERGRPTKSKQGNVPAAALPEITRLQTSRRGRKANSFTNTISATAGCTM